MMVIDLHWATKMNFRDEIDNVIRGKRLYSIGKRLPSSWEEGFRTWLPLAEAGDSQAQFNVGVCYSLGTGVDLDFAQAYQWFQKAAAQGEPRAHYNLSMMFAEGHFVQQDPDHARALIEKAAALGEERATRQMTIARAREAFKEGDRDTARELYRQGAALGIEEARAGLLACDVSLVSVSHGLEIHALGAPDDTSDADAAYFFTPSIRLTFKNNSDQTIRLKCWIEWHNEGEQNEKGSTDVIIEPRHQGDAAIDLYLLASDDHTWGKNAYWQRNLHAFSIRLNDKWYPFFIPAHPVWPDAACLEKALVANRKTFGIAGSGT
jgi:Sel1 repeat